MAGPVRFNTRVREHSVLVVSEDKRSCPRVISRRRRRRSFVLTESHSPSFSLILNSIKVVEVRVLILPDYYLK